MKAVFKKLNNSIMPTDEDGARMLQSIPQGATCLVEYVKNRNYENHKRYFAMLDICFDNQDFYDNKEHFRKAIQMLAGHYEALVIYKKGEAETHYIPKSIAFDKMDETEFNELFDKSITAFLGRYGNGITESEILKIINFS